MPNFKNACNFFKYNIDEGMKALSIFELFFGVYHMIVDLIIGFFYLEPMAENYALDDNRPERVISGFAGVMELMFQSLLTFFLFFQGIMAVLLYPIGWRTRNITVIYLWCFGAAVNFLMVFALLIIQVIPTWDVYGKGTASGGAARHLSMAVYYYRIPFHFLLYFFYAPYAIAVGIGFIKWAKDAGIAVQISVAQVKTEVGPLTEGDKDKENAGLSDVKVESGEDAV